MADQPIPLSKADLMKSLQEHISNLIDFCSDYDQGKTLRAKPISTTLRVLFHNSKGKGGGVSLLTQLSMIDLEWLDLAFPVPVIQGIDTCTLVHWPTSQFGHSVEPNLTPYLDVVRCKKFPKWWTDPVANNLQHGTYSRELLVRYMANKEAAHVDSHLHEKYRALREGTFVPIRGNNEIQKDIKIKDVHYACIRTIAHETLLTLQKNLPEAFLQPYVFDAHPYRNYAHKHLKTSEIDASQSSWRAFSWRARHEQDVIKANKIFQEGFTLFPNSDGLIIDYAIFLHTKLNDSEAAESMFCRALELKPDQASYKSDYALFLTNLRKSFGLAEQLFTEALNVAPTCVGFLVNYGVFLEKCIKDYDKAESIYKRALDADPNDSLALTAYNRFLQEIRNKNPEEF